MNLYYKYKEFGFQLRRRRRLDARNGKVFPMPRGRPRFFTLLGKIMPLNCVLCVQSELTLTAAL